MANKTIKMELSHKSIQDTIKQLRAYQKSLVSKNEELSAGWQNLESRS